MDISSTPTNTTSKIHSTTTTTAVLHPTKTPSQPPTTKTTTPQPMIPSTLSSSKSIYTSNVMKPQLLYTENVNYANSSQAYASVSGSLTAQITSSNVTVSQNVFDNPMNSVHSKDIPKKPYKKPDYSEDNLESPTIYQGLIIKSAEGLKIKQYIESIASIIGAENIMYASRLSRD